MDFKKYTIVPIAIDESKKIVCKLISKRKNVRKKDKRESSENIVLIDVDENLDVPLLSTRIFQYKIGRSGSTLLSNMLDQDSDWKIISEPTLINKLHEVENIDYSKYLKKIIEILSIKEFEGQKYCYFDFNSQTIFARHHIKTVFDDTIEFYLYRRPVEVFDSLSKKPPGWLRKYKSVSEYIHKAIDSCTNIKIHYYRNVLSMQVVEWLYRKINKKLSTSLYDKMKSMMNFYSKDKNIEYQPEELNSSQYTKGHLEFVHNEKFTNFFLSNPPYEHLNNGCREIEKLDWNQQREEILKLFGKRNKPFIVTNIITDKNIFHRIVNSIGVDKKMRGLISTRENYFTWYKSDCVDKKLPHNYDIHSSWGESTYEDWKTNKDMYLVVKGEITPSEHPSFMFFKKNSDHKAKKGAIRISHLGAITSEHYDWGETILYVGDGQKRMYLLEESISNELGTYSREHKLFRRIIPNLVYLDTFKNKLDMSKVWVGDINENEFIYMPAKWTHLTITRKEHTWSLNFRRTARLPNKINSHENLDEIIRLEQEIHPYLRKGDFRD